MPGGPRRRRGPRADGGTPDTSLLPRHLTTAVCGHLEAGSGVGLRWPDGVVTDAVTSTVTGMGTAS